MDRLYRYASEPFLLLLIGVAAVIAIALDFSASVEHWFADRRAWEITTQFVFGVVLGGAVTLAYRIWENERTDWRRRQDEERERQTIQRGELIEFFRSAVSLQHKYKKIRRTLRAVSYVDAEKDERLIERGVFERLMDMLEDCQLRAEILYRQATAQSDLFGLKQNYFSKKSKRKSSDKLDITSRGDLNVGSNKNLGLDNGYNSREKISNNGSLSVSDDKIGKELIRNLNAIQDYLRKILFQYEREYAGRRDIDPKALMVIGKSLREFIESKGDDDNSRISKNLLLPAERVREIILRLIAKSTPGGDLDPIDNSLLSNNSPPSAESQTASTEPS